jgi:PAS domain S-box-containing protein
MAREVSEAAPPPVAGAKPYSDEVFRLLVESVQDYAIFLLSPEGNVMTWNAGAERIKGYAASEIIGQHFSKFYATEAVENRWPQRELEIATAMGRFADEGWRVRKDGTTFWASVVITALRSKETGELLGFAKVTRDLSERRILEERTQELNRELRSQMAKLAESRTQLELRNHELRRMSSQLVHIQDQERRRIAREMHDDLGQVLVALKLTLDTATEFAARGEAAKLAADALAKVRNLSYVLHPPLLDEIGLLPALHLYLEGFEKRSDLRITIDCKPLPFPRLSGEVETSIFRIIQEAITNVHRHSQSPDARVEIHQQTDRIFIRIRDFGVGIPMRTDASDAMLRSGVGVSSMRERVKQLGGELSVHSAEPGTLIEAVLPLFQ